MSLNSNRLFSEFLSQQDLNLVNYYSYFACKEQENLISLLPSDHCLYYPLEFEVQSKKIVNGELNFFNEVLYKNFISKKSIDEKKIRSSSKPRYHQRVLIVNLLDNCYGHTFLKLLNLFEIYRKYSETFDIWVIAPIAVKHYIPEDKFIISEISIGFNDAMNCYSLKPILDEIKSQYQSFDFVTLNTYSSFENKNDVLNFFPFVEKNISTQKRYITFYYRSDYFRTWGGTRQYKLITEFIYGLKKYFDKSIEFVILGDKDNFIFPTDFTDKRTNAFGETVDKEYNQIFLQSHMVIGLIGSNMLQPSMFCPFTIHLVPRSKITIVAEEFFNVHDSAIQNWFNNIYIFGNENLSDLKPKKLLEQTILLFLTYSAKYYKKKIFEDSNFQSIVSQSEFLKTEFSFFNFEEANKLKQEVIDFSFRYNLWRMRLNKILKLLKVK